MPTSSSSTDDRDLRARHVTLTQERQGPTALLADIALWVAQRDVDAHVTLAHVLALLEQGLGMERAAFGVVDRDGRVALDCARGVVPEHQGRARYAAGEGVIGQVFASGQAAVVPNIREEPRFLDRAKARLHLDLDAYSFVCVPLLHDGVVIGTLSGDVPRARYASIADIVDVIKLVGRLVLPLIHERRGALWTSHGVGEASDVHAQIEQVAREALVGVTPAMRELHRLVAKVAGSHAPVLIQGEPGTGKELIARTIHATSPRADKPLVTVSCASLPETLVEAELFGQVRESPRGAPVTRRGRFELAHGGTLFLDEVADLSPAMQVKLLRVLQQGVLTRVGDDESVTVDVRVIAATHSDVGQAVAAGRFRQDLYYRLSVFPIVTTPLRERRDDVVRLAHHFLARSAMSHSKRMQRISEPALTLLTRYAWPGNVRELESCISRAVLLAHYGVVRQHHLPAVMQPGADAGPALSLRAMTDAFERDLLSDAMRRTGGDRNAAARMLRTTPRVLSSRLRRLGV